MEPMLLKIKNLINKLNFSSWFHNWFIYKKDVRQQYNITYNINLPSMAEPSVELPDNTGQPRLTDQKTEVKFTADQIGLVTKVNTVHKINGNSDYDFQKDYKWALYYIQYKPAIDWPCNAALRIAQAMQDIDFFTAFEDISDPEEKNKFDDLKGKINYLYSNIIQELRHTDKRNRIEKQFKTPYHNTLQKKPEVKDTDYEDAFNEFQELLIKLFENFKLKQ